MSSATASRSAEPSARRALFLDRDGVLIHDDANYVRRVEDVRFMPGVSEALSALASLTAKIIIVTNQSQVGRGITSLRDVDAINRYVVEEISKHGGRIDHVYVCPHSPDAECNCRKPRPGLLLRAADEHQLHLPSCVFVGDRPSDMAAAAAAGCHGIRILSTLTPNQVTSPTAVEGPTFPGLPEALSEIVRVLNDSSLPFIDSQ